ncbi:MAG: hypothetical protein HRU32_02190 [Rhodobacteraceae bacterium]|nr:hypothetical protein [Paracoccaceae bacterium]
MLTSLLAGCSGGGNPNESGFSAIDMAASTLFDEIAGLGISNVATLPTSGSASYAGYMGIDNAPFGGEIIGDMTMTVDFATEGITGAATNFINSDDIRYSGTLGISNGAFDRTADPAREWQFEADIDGTLSAVGESHTIDALMSGDFTGPGQEGAVGIVTGAITSSRSGLSNIAPGDALFVAARQ